MNISHHSSPDENSTPENGAWKRLSVFPGIHYFINSNIGVKLNIGSVILVGLTILVITLSITAGWITNKSINQVKDLRAPMVRVSTEARANLLKMIADLRGYLVLSDTINIEGYKQTRQIFNQNLAELDALSTRWKNSEYIEHFNKIEKIFSEWSVLADRLFELHDSPRENQPALRLAHLEVQPLNIPVLYDIENLIQLQKQRTVSTEDIALLEEMIMFHTSFETMIISLRAYATSGEISLKFSHAIKLSVNDAFWSKLKNKYDLLTDAQQAKFDHIIKNRKQILALAAQIYEILDGERAYEDLYLFRTQALPRAREMLQILDKMTTEQHQLLQIDLDKGEKRLSRVQVQIFWGGIVALFLAGGLAVVFKRSITSPIERLTKTAEKIADGNLTATAQVESQDEIGRLAETFNSMTTQLRETISTLEKNSTHLDELVGMRTLELVNSKKKLELEIVERKKIEVSLRESEEKFRSIFETSPLGILHINKDGIVTAYNEHLIKIIGASKEKPIDFDRLKSLQNKKMIDSLSKALSGEKTQYEGDYLSVNGEFGTPVRANFAPTLSADGHVTGVTGIVEDITERKEAEAEKEMLEAQLRQAFKMEAVGTLSGGIAHDFNNILGIILGNTELALDDIPEGNPAKENLNEINIACFRAREVVRQLLNFSRKAEQLIRPLKINDIVIESMKLLRASIPSIIEIDLKIPEKNETILADATQIHQVLINLCTNAAHAMEEKGGILTVDVSTILLNEKTISDYDEVTAGAYVQVAVNDQGSGIAPDVRKKMFDPYYTTKDVGKGTGMGLAVVHGIMKNHNGTISVYSEVGKGTSIKVLFPLTEEPSITEATISKDLVTGNETILLIDDEISLAEMEGTILKRLGYKVETCSDPEEALASFYKDPSRFDLIITDMTMPHLTGEQVAKKILEKRPDIPIIICSGFNKKINSEIGIRRYLEKPIEMKTFARSIRNVLDGN